MIITIFILIIGVIVKIILNTCLLNIDPNEFILGGIRGAAFANTVSCILVCMIEIIIMKKYINIEFNIKKFIKPIVSTIIMMICLICTYNILLGIVSKKMCILISILISIIIYCVMLIVLRTFSNDEIKLLPCGKKLYKVLKFLKIYS